jgi:hypothetical protein
VTKEIKDIIITFKSLTKSKHFINRARIRYIPSIVSLLNAEIFEYYRNPDGSIEKFCVRVRKPNLDFVYIISNQGKIITGWANSKDDTHKTLDFSLYERGA